MPKMDSLIFVISVFMVLIPPSYSVILEVMHVSL